MRILALTNLYPNPDQPHRAAFNRQKFRALAERNRVSVIAPIAWTEEHRLRRREPTRLPDNRRTTLDGIAVEHPRYLFPPKVMRGWYGHCFRWSVRRSFLRAVAEFKPDVVLAPWAYPDGWAAVTLGREAKLPVVVVVHGTDVLNMTAFRSRRRRTAEAVQGADAVVAVSQDLADRVVALGADPSRVRTLYDGVDLARFSPGSRDQASTRLGLDGEIPILLFVGNLLPVKGPDVLIDACDQLARQGLAFRAYVIGEGPLRPHLEMQVARLGLSERIEFVGSVEHRCLPDWYRAADLLVLPSRSEGVPSVVLEAAACGRPFVASRVGGVPEVAHLAASRLTPSGDVESLAQAIAASLAEPRAPAERRQSAAWSLEDAALELEDVLRRAIGRTAVTRRDAKVSTMGRVIP